MKHIAIISLLFMLGFSPTEPDFKDEQFGYARVVNAYKDKWPVVKAQIKSVGVDPDHYELFIRAFKFEEDVEVWVKDKDSSSYIFLTKYKFCSNVGYLGPKRKQGDLQIPEGAYYLSKFNPESNYHLSLKVSYPNKADSIKGYKPDLGGMIFIHGGCNTIGCIPITDNYIRELYVLSLQARFLGQEHIPIHILPARLTDENFNLLGQFVDNPPLLDFWQSLRPSYLYFEKHRKIPSYSINKRGEYEFQTQGL